MGLLHRPRNNESTDDKKNKNAITTDDKIRRKIVKAIEQKSTMKKSDHPCSHEPKEV